MRNELNEQKSADRQLFVQMRGFYGGQGSKLWILIITEDFNLITDANGNQLQRLVVEDQEDPAVRTK